VGCGQVVGRLVTPDPVMDLERIRRGLAERMERDDLAILDDPAQIAREGGDPASTRWIRGDERGADDD
jgi:hypothetical protein